MIIYTVIRFLLQKSEIDPIKFDQSKGTTRLRFFSREISQTKREISLCRPFGRHGRI
jgi:hypothetical protein